MSNPRKASKQQSLPAVAKRQSGRRTQFQQDQKEENRKKLLNAAMTLFTKKPFALVTIEDIVHHAKVSRPTFYLHFKSKFEIVIALNSDTVEQTFVFYDQFASGGDFSEERIFAWLTTILQQYRDIPQLILTLLEVEAADSDFYDDLLKFHGDLIRRLGIHIPAFKIAADAAESNGQAWMRAHMLLQSVDFFCVALGVRGAPFAEGPALRMLAKEFQRFIAETPSSQKSGRR